ncbi:MAG: RNA polymerase sigma factor [Chitinophagaceae bacterium]|nr:MAG: RNA polymerase sigma factor [Chitinophagaceae bacterium]
MTTTDFDIDELVEGCRNNQRRAQEQLYRQFYRFAMTVALRYSRDESDAADILSHAFVKVFKSIHTYDSSKGALQTWIKRIVVNEGLDHIKSRERFSQNVELETVPEPVISNAVLEQLGADEIMKLIHKLPPATHAVFILYAVEGYTHKQIAIKLNISEGTSKWHLSEARKSLQQQISIINKG